MRLGGRAADGVEVGEDDVEDEARVGETALTEGQVEAVEVQLGRMGRVAVVLAQPLDQFAVGIERAETGAEPLLHGRVGALPQVEDVVVDGARRW